MQKTDAVVSKVLNSLKTIKGNVLSFVLSDCIDNDLLLAFERQASERGCFINSNNIIFDKPINYFFEKEFDSTKSIRAFGGLSWGMDYEYATDFNNDVINGLAFINYMLCKKRNWLSLELPGKLKAQYSGIDLNTLTDKMYNAILYDQSNLSEKQRKLRSILWRGKSVEIKGDEVDLTFSINGKRAVSCSGQYNLPGGEVFVAPLEGSMNGWIYYKNLDWGLLNDVKLLFRNGMVTEYSAKNKIMTDWLKKKLFIDNGSNKACEFGIGTNDLIDFFIGDSLWDEKKYGTFHIALGGGYGSNISSIRHWDMVKDNNSSYTIFIDNEPILKNGKILI
jgi:leucyl aminopeptidase (aminopeptidase T)